MAHVVKAEGVRMFIGGVEIKRSDWTTRTVHHIHGGGRGHRHEMQDDGHLGPPKWDSLPRSGHIAFEVTHGS
jgi:hypothetical protein